MPFGPRRAFADRYDQTVTVDVDVGDAEVDLHWVEEPINTVGSRHHPRSALSPDQADDLSDQLRAAAAYAHDPGATVEPYAQVLKEREKLREEQREAVARDIEEGRL